ncbi:MAG: M28 family peptidase [Vicinamibacterales bacterium]
MGLVTALVMCGVFFQEHAAGQRGQRPAVSSPAAAPSFVSYPLSASGQAYGAIDGHHLWQYVKEQSDIARHYRDSGHPQFWGRIVGTSSDVEDVDWLLKKYREIGLTDTHSQPVLLFHPQWSGDSWDVSVTGGGRTTKLTSAQPPYGATSTDGKTLDLPVVYAGLGSDADFAGRDVRGKAVLLVSEARGGNAVRKAQDNGAAAILSADLRGGNYSFQAYRENTTVPTFNLGTEDGLMLRDQIAKAPVGDPPHIKLRLDGKWMPGQKSFLVWGTLPGVTDETIYVIAHRDGWFDAAGDNATGVATMLGLAEYFARVPQNQRRRTMIFIGTDGHHANSPSGYGREWLAANREKFFSRTALMINAEHPAEVLTHGGAAQGWTESTTPDQWYAGGAARPQLTKTAADAFHEFGLPIWAQPSATPPGGDLGPFVAFLPGLVAQSNDFRYFHTTGDTPENIPWSGLEAATRAYAKIVDQVNKLPLTELQRPAEARTPRIDFASCPAWVRDSSAQCTENKERACAVTSPGC